MRLARQLLSVFPMIQFPRRFVSLTVLVALVGFAGSAAAQAPDKVDRSLRDGRNKGQAQQAIIKIKPGYETWVRHLLAQRGKQIGSELPSINAVTAELTPSDLDAICLSGFALGCSGDVLV